ncbi:MAG: DUF1684 domain-containing protein [Aestuariibaculum sp.]
MKKVLIMLIWVCCLFSCNNGKQPLLGATEFQKTLNAKFKDVSESPLKDSDRKRFKGLEFFKYDSIYAVKAVLIHTPSEQPFKMKTTTNRLPNYVKYGEIKFSIKDKEFRLSVYQNLELTNKIGYEDYLFLPFLDETNGLETYGGGRYIDIRIPENDTLLIDFNSAYNPYCAYNDKYSCPLVPRINYLKTRIEAGVKNFKK